jgi:hypothetical protein
VTGGGVSGSNMPNLPWTARPDVSPVEDTSLESLLAGVGLPAGADAELRPVADVLAALSGRPAGDELTGLSAARAEFRRHVVPPVQARQSHRRRPSRLASRLAVKVGAASALVVMAVGGGAAAAAYGGVLPVSWQQFAHRAIGAPAYKARHDTSTVAARPAVPRSRHPAHQTYSRGLPARHGFRHHAWPPHHQRPPAVRPSVSPPPPTVRPFVHHGGLPGAHPAHSAVTPPGHTRADPRPLARA